MGSRYVVVIAALNVASVIVFFFVSWYMLNMKPVSEFQFHSAECM